MAEVVIAFFGGLLVYRGFCRMLGILPFPVVQITINNYRSCDDA